MEQAAGLLIEGPLLIRDTALEKTAVRVSSRAASKSPKVENEGFDGCSVARGKSRSTSETGAADRGSLERPVSFDPELERHIFSAMATEQPVQSSPRDRRVHQ